MAWQQRGDFGDASGSKVVSLGQDTWNISDGYTKIKILRLLIELDLYETIAKFGAKDLDETNRIQYDNRIVNRIEGLNRVSFLLRQLLGNCRFSVEKNPKNKRQIDILFERINNVEKVLDGISYVVSNEVTKESDIVIDEDHFNTCFNILRNIKDELNFPINNAGLIFRQSDEVNLDALMNDVIFGG